MQAVQWPSGMQVFERGWLSSNNVLFVDDNCATLVDSGYVTHTAQTLALVDGALGRRPLDMLLNTHLHSDHCGGNAALQARHPSLQTHIPPGDADAVQAWDEEALSFRATGQQCPRFRIDSLLMPGTERILGGNRWEVWAAPGHDPHSVVLFEPSTRTLISADALWESGFGVVFPELLGEPSFDEVAQTLDLIESLQPRCVIPGHGRPFMQVDGSIVTARRRLDDLSTHPLKHARHAFKVLIKFKLMDSQRMSHPDWEQWCLTTPYLQHIHDRFFAETGVLELSHELLSELTQAGLAAVDAQLISDKSR
jgi:glyoxylase-like metal-dependent hydrolase (beta-lactamase superfamily II)